VDVDPMVGPEGRAFVAEPLDLDEVVPPQVVQESEVSA
jgi:hypothetical protein